MSTSRVNAAYPISVFLVVLAVMWILPYLQSEPVLGLHFVSLGSSLLIAGAFILLFHGWLKADDGDESFRATLAGSFMYAVVGYGLLAGLAFLPDRVGGFHSLGSSFAGWLVTVFAWPFVTTWMTACGLGVTVCPP